ncbi:MAG: CpsD/CapB family tyrosine-protein kinase [Chloroflexota bacterium]|nr:CpsD/CapB family tyrosine-protein kinase [Chloroflexota bacterium]
MTKQLITLTSPGSAAAEAYRQLYINLAFSNGGQGSHKFLITSSTASEDKSLVLANLAVVAAQMGQKVVVMDADLRQPQQHQLFGLSNDLGVSGVVEGKADTADVLKTVPDVADLRVLTSGPQLATPSQVLASRRMEDLIAELSTLADLVLIDVPPVLVVSDASVLASKVDGVLLVVKAGQTKRDQARRAKEHLEKVGANIIGVVLDNVTADAALQGYDQ